MYTEFDSERHCERVHIQGLQSVDIWRLHLVNETVINDFVCPFKEEVYKSKETKGPSESRWRGGVGWCK